MEQSHPSSWLFLKDYVLPLFHYPVNPARDLHVPAYLHDNPQSFSLQPSTQHHFVELRIYQTHLQSGFSVKFFHSYGKTNSPCFLFDLQVVVYLRRAAKFLFLKHVPRYITNFFSFRLKK